MMDDPETLEGDGGDGERYRSPLDEPLPHVGPRLDQAPALPDQRSFDQGKEDGAEGVGGGVGVIVRYL